MCESKTPQTVSTIKQYSLQDRCYTDSSINYKADNWWQSPGLHYKLAISP